MSNELHSVCSFWFYVFFFFTNFCIQSIVFDLTSVFIQIMFEFLSFVLAFAQWLRAFTSRFACYFDAFAFLHSFCIHLTLLLHPCTYVYCVQNRYSCIHFTRVAFIQVAIVFSKWYFSFYGIALELILSLLLY